MSHVKHSNVESKRNDYENVVMISTLEIITVRFKKGWLCPMHMAFTLHGLNGVLSVCSSIQWCLCQFQDHMSPRNEGYDLQ